VCCYSESLCCEQYLWPFQTPEKIHSFSGGRSRRLGRESQTLCARRSSQSYRRLFFCRRGADMTCSAGDTGCESGMTVSCCPPYTTSTSGTTRLSCRTGRRSPEPACRPPGDRDAGSGSLIAKEPRPGMPSAERAAALAHRFAPAASIPVTRPTAMPASSASVLAAFAMSFRSLSSSNSRYPSSALKSGRWRIDSMTESLTAVVPRLGLPAAPT
jgi:hypothetical protein